MVNQQSWIKRNWKWLLSLIVLMILSLSLFFTLTAGHLSDFTKAYLEPQLFKGAVELAQKNENVSELLGEIEPINKMAILEGDVVYSNQGNKVEFSVKIDGTNRKARIDVIANKNKNVWEYEKITIRIKNPPENRQTIKVK